MTRAHVDLFTGIGGFALAAQANGVQTVAMCEIDNRCRAFLGKTWPEVELHDDIRTFDATRYAGTTWLLTGGVPCQPASRAGKQRGSADDRWLWPQALRCLSEIRPAWAIFENPPGIRDLAEYRVQPQVDDAGAAIGNLGDVFHRSGPAHIYKILEEIEAQGYAVQVYSLPAASVDAPHLRERYWIVCHLADTTSRGTSTAQQRGCRDEYRCNVDDCLADARRLGGRQDEPQQGQDRRTADRRAGARLGDTECFSRGGWRQQERIASSSYVGDDRSSPWRNAVWVPCADGKFRRAPDDSFLLADGIHGAISVTLAGKHRSLLAALGNSIVPQVAERIIRAMVEAENESE